MKHHLKKQLLHETRVGLGVLTHAMTLVWLRLAIREVIIVFEILFLALTGRHILSLGTVLDPTRDLLK